MCITFLFLKNLTTKGFGRNSKAMNPVALMFKEACIHLVRSHWPGSLMEGMGAVVGVGESASWPPHALRAGWQEGCTCLCGAWV